MTPVRSVVCVLALFLAAGTYAAATFASPPLWTAAPLSSDDRTPSETPGSASQGPHTVCYDAALGTTPQDQGWQYSGDVNASGTNPTPTVSNGTLRVAAPFGELYWLRQDPAIDFSQRVTLTARLKIHHSNYIPNIGSGTREGFYFILFDRAAPPTYQIGIASNGVNLNAISRPFQPLTPIALADGRFHDFRFEIAANVATLSIDGTPIATQVVPTSDTGNSGFYNILFGPSAGLSRSDTEIASVCYTTTSLQDVEPTIRIAMPFEGAVLTRNQDVRADFACDAPGLQACTGTVPSAAPVDTTIPGRYRFAVTARNGAGREVTREISYEVRSLSDTGMQSAEPLPEASYSGVAFTTGADVYYASGRGLDGLETGRVWRYSTRENQWSPAAPMHQPRFHAASTRLLDGRVLVAGGYANGVAISSVEMFNPATQKWQIVSGMNGPRAVAALTTLADGRVLATGGAATHADPFQRYLASAEVYDPVANVWSQLPNMSDRRIGHIAALLPDGRVLTAGGADWAEYKASAQYFNPVTNVFSAAPTLPGDIRRYGAASSTLPDGRILVAGGYNYGGTLASALTFAAETGWQAASALSSARYFTQMVATLDGRTIAAGGVRPGSVDSATDLYDPVSATFAAAPSLRQPHYAGGYTALVGGGAIFLGGLQTTEIGTDVVDIWNGDRLIPSIQVAPAEGTVGGSFDVRVTISGSLNGVSLSVADRTYGPAMPGPDGVAVFSGITAPGLTAGAHANALFAWKNGDGVYAGARGRGTLTLRAATPPTPIENAVKKIKVGAAPFFTVASPDGRRIYVANSGDSTLSVIDTSTDCVIATVSLPRRPGGIDALHLAITPDGSRVYSVDEHLTNRGTVNVLSTATNQLEASFAVGRRPTHIAARPDGAEVYVVNDYDFTVSVIATTDQQVLTIALPPHYPHHIAFSADSKRAFITRYGAGHPGGVVILNTSTRSVVANLTLSQQGGETYPIVSADGRWLYLKSYTIVPDQRVLSTLSIDTVSDTYALVKTFTGPAGSLWMPMSPDTSRGFLFSAASPIVQSFDAAALQLANSAPLSAPASFPVWDSTSSRLYVPMPSADAVAVMDAGTGQTLATIPVGDNPVYLVEAAGKKYVTNHADGSISVLGAPGTPAIPCRCDIAMTGQEDQPIAISLASSCEASSADRWIVVSGPSHGTLSGIGPDLVYTPHRDYFGTDAFTYVASAGGIQSPPSSVSISVAPVNDAPELRVGGPYVAYAGTLLRLDAVASDAEGDAVGIQWDLDGDGAFEAAGPTAFLIAPELSTSIAVRALDARAAPTASAASVIVVSADPAPGPPGPVDPYFLPRASFMEWDAVAGRLRANYGPRFEPDQLATSCMVASRMLGGFPLWRTVTSGFFDLIVEDKPNYPAFVAMMDALPAEYKYVGLGYAVKCRRLAIPGGAELGTAIGISVDCPQLRELYMLLVGKRPEETLADVLPVPERLKEIIRTKLVICPFSLDLSGYECEEKIEIAGELAEMLLPGLGSLLNSPVGKFLANSLLCKTIEIPDLTFEFPDIDWGLGEPGCWFGCGSRSGGGGGDGDGGGDDDGDGGGSGSGSGGGFGSFYWETWPPFGRGDWDWQVIPPSAPTGPGNYVQCSLLPSNWQAITWGQLLEHGAARGASAMTMLDVLAACTLPKPVEGLPFRSDASIALTGPTSARVGDVATYTVAVRTAGPGAARIARAMITASSAFEVIPTDGVACRNESPTTARCDFGNVAVGGTASLPLTLRFASGGPTVLRAGLVSYVADPNLNDNIAVLDVDVAKRVPVISWSPSGLTYGGALGPSQLNAKADVAGNFQYSEAAGTVLRAGAHILTATFRPSNADAVAEATASASVAVSRAALSVRADETVRELGADNPAFTASFSGFVAGEGPAALTGTLVFETSATRASAVGSYPLSVSGVTSTDYAVTFVPGTLRIVDTTAPSITGVTPSVAALWSPNHKMVPLSVTVDATDASGNVSCRVVTVSSNEPANGTGDGDTGPDWEISGGLNVALRAERAGAGAGRVYTINVECRDPSNNVARGSTTVSVPRDARR